MFLEHQLGPTNVVEVGELVLVHKLDTENIHSLPWVGVDVQSSLGSFESPGTCLSPRTPQDLVCLLLHTWGFVMGWTHVCLEAQCLSYMYRKRSIVRCGDASPR